ncbi:MAG: hypothetical protein K2J90_04000 [Lachnospiraceae bacterium]|nr:hypothetical protein [Lachnospiraceae bacterium]
MRRIIKWVMMGIIVILFVPGIVFFPEYIVKGNDGKYLDDYQLYEQDIVDTGDTALSLEEKLEMLIAPDNQEYSIVDAYTVSYTLENDPQLFTELEKQLHLLEDRNLIPVISDKIDWEEGLNYANLVALTVDYKPGKALSVWQISYSQKSDDVTDLLCVVDASTYKIYEINVAGENCVAEFQDEYIRHIKETGQDDYSYALQCVKQYWSYLNDKNGNDIEFDLFYETELYDDSYKKILSEVYMEDRNYVLQYYWSYSALPFLQIKWMQYYDENSSDGEKESQGW